MKKLKEGVFFGTSVVPFDGIGLFITGGELPSATSETVNSCWLLSELLNVMQPLEFAERVAKWTESRFTS
jgi:hypothetical protein